jgi:holliday junction DNA helicase RuvA
MIVFLEGTLVEKKPTRIVLAVRGVGYEVFIPLSSFDRLPAPDQSCRILIYHAVREDAETLYGFCTDAERRMFTLLLDVSGIGPRIALSALSGMSVRDIKMAIAGNDVKRLSSISGVGRKTAERMVIELKDKISDGEVMEAMAGDGASTAEHVRMRDAVLALVSLGYKQADAEKMVRLACAAPGMEKAGVEELVRMALAGGK